MLHSLLRNRVAALFALAFALWAAAPGVRMCTVGMREPRPECQRKCTPDSPAASACARTAQRCAGTDRPCAGHASKSCPGARTCCIGGPNGGAGIPTRTAQVPPASPLVQFAALLQVLDAPPALASGTLRPREFPPPRPIPKCPTSVRGPPLA